MKDEEVWESLWIQVEALCGRELGEIERGWMKEKNKDNVENYTCKQNDGWGRMEERRKRDIKDRLYIMKKIFILVIERVLETIAAAAEFLDSKDFDLDDLVYAKDFAKLSLLQTAANAVSESKEIKK